MTLAEVDLLSEADRSFHGIKDGPSGTPGTPMDLMRLAGLAAQSQEAAKDGSAPVLHHA